MNQLSESDLERLDRFLQGTPDAAEKKEVIDLIRKDAAWREEYELRLSLREAGRRAFHSEFRDRLKQLDGAESRVRRVHPVWLAVAASAALLVSALLWLFPGKQQDTLLAEYRSFPNIVLPIEKSASEFSDRERAYQAYELGNYPQAVTAFASLPGLETSDSIYVALCHFENGNLEDAETLFQSLRTTPELRWAHVADWYTMWVHVKRNELNEARKLLTKIHDNTGHRYHEQAGNLLREF